jgi:hypothetical protein
MADAITCAVNMSDEQFMNAVLVKDATTGAIMINSMLVEGDCADVVPAASCEGYQSISEWIGTMKRAAGIDACGRVAVRFFVGS